MNTKIPNIEVIRSLWRRVKKDVKVRDLKPVKDVKGGSGLTGRIQTHHRRHWHRGHHKHVALCAQKKTKS